MKCQRLVTRFLCLNLGAFLALNSVHSSTLTPSLGASQTQYATEKPLSSVFELGLEFKSDEKTSDLAKEIFDVKFSGFYEPGSLGDKSLDLDPVVYRFNFIPDGTSHLWVGRTHPFLEGGHQKKIQARSALGANWQHNTTEPWDPKVGGWIGVGASVSLTKQLRVTIAGTPFFLPNSGPKLNLSETDFSSGSRFARLPPQYININDIYYPLRYRIETGDISKIVLQPQAYFSIESDQAKIFAWSSPSVDPVLSTEGLLRVSGTKDPVVQVTARPSFPRQNFLGAQYQYQYSKSNWIHVKTTNQATIEVISRQPTISTDLEMTEFIKVGFVNRFEKKSQVSGTISAPKTPDFYNRLLSVTLGPSDLIDWQFKPSFSYEKHFSNQASDQVYNPILTYNHPTGATVFVQARIIAADETAYWGAWREYDSVSIGGRLKW